MNRTAFPIKADKETGASFNLSGTMETKTF